MAYKVSVWLHEYVFTSDFHILAVAGCDMVLGINWLKTLGFIGWNFLKKVIEFSVHGTNYRLVGFATPVSLSPTPLTTLDHALGDKVNLVHQPYSLTTSSLPASPTPDFLQELLIQFF